MWQTILSKARRGFIGVMSGARNAAQRALEPLPKWLSVPLIILVIILVVIPLVIGVIALFFCIIATFIFGIIAVMSLFVAVPVYFLWNWLCPELFGLPVISFWQSWGLTFLFTLLVKGVTLSSQSSNNGELSEEVREQAYCGAKQALREKRTLEQQ